MFLHECTNGMHTECDMCMYSWMQFEFKNPPYFSCFHCFTAWTGCFPTIMQVRSVARNFHLSRLQSIGCNIRCKFSNIFWFFKADAPEILQRMHPPNHLAFFGKIGGFHSFICCLFLEAFFVRGGRYLQEGYLYTITAMNVWFLMALTPPKTQKNDLPIIAPTSQPKPTRILRHLARKCAALPPALCTILTLGLDTSDCHKSFKG